MTTFKAFRETALPGTLQPYAIYFVAPTSKPNYVEIYVSDATGSSAKRVLTDTDVQGLINASIGGITGLQVVADIPARDALNPTTNQLVLVLNATGDTTVTSGAATYIYRVSTTSWTKISEAESLDLVLQWANIQGRPTSSVSAIDAAVSNSHTHANKTQLDKIGENANGLLTYNGVLPTMGWNSLTW
ncbi:hypothetical protein [Microcystis aeruginosa]|uniref:Uncharacterized protein n=1 Tax=Microcystis aeruginosa NIES-2521 TaxID=2303983 RepID=A0A5A5RZB6_MICAE|nr:hypothetical protein [Microcystis aeruginosa]GCA81884.1 hypothetical protein MiTs_03903 [Microcystis aeruginosa NIES-2521]